VGKQRRQGRAKKLSAARRREIAKLGGKARSKGASHGDDGAAARQEILVTYQRDKKRVTWTVPTMTDAKALMRMVREKELEGINPVEAVERHRASAQPTTPYPPLREAMERWIARQIQNQEFRGATGEAYTYALAKWAWPTLGDVSVDKITRVMVGAVIERMRAAKKSRALIAHVRMRSKACTRG